MKTITIDVTQEDIDKGIPINLHTCPIARAIKRAIELKVTVGVGMVSAYGPYWIKIWVAKLPPEAEGWRRAFDIGHRPHKPFSFQLEVP